MAFDVKDTTEVRQAAHKMHVLDRSGHTTFVWETSDEAKAAAAVFMQKLNEGFGAVKTDADGQNAVAVRTFDETAERLVLTPRLVGG